MEIIYNNGLSTHSEGKCNLKLGIDVADNYWHCLMLPQSANRKERVKAIGTVFAEIINNASLSVKEYKGTKTEMGIHIQQAQALRALGRFLGYFLNCTSWKEGTMEKYDQIEFQKRLESLSSFLK